VNPHRAEKISPNFGKTANNAAFLRFQKLKADRKNVLSRIKPTILPIFAVGLELAYLLMPLWAILLAMQTGVFRN
jgi:hypothetical protein